MSDIMTEELLELNFKVGACFRAFLEMQKVIEELHEQSNFPLGMTPICGWKWLAKHQNDLKDWRPTIELSDGHSRHTITGTPKQCHEAIKAYLKRQ